MLKLAVCSTLLLFLALNCGSNKKNGDRPADSHKQGSTARTDTLAVRPPRPGPGLPPGSAEVTGRILTYQEYRGDSAAVLTLQISSVSEYGSATPAIRTGKTLRISVPSAFRKKIQALETDKKIVCLINYQQVLGSRKSQSEWMLRSISSAEDSQ